jgi:light-regulated signal transduction histidine kinase (bacteriophytochrome)
VHLLGASEPDRAWIIAADLQPVAAPRRWEAADAVDRRARAEPLDARVCEQEPIHIPGAVQPHAVLLVADPASGEVTACSDNFADIFDRPPAEALGCPLSSLLPPELMAAIDGVAAAGEELAAPQRLDGVVGPSAMPVVALVHVRAGRLLLELEPAPVRGEDFGAPTISAVSDGLARLRRGATLEVVAQDAAEQIRALSGFERVLIYRFDRDWNGTAIAESLDPAAYDSLLGLHFPASDIPAQARALYVHAPARFVFDRDYVPSPLVAAPGLANRPVDLSLVAARSLSPIHLEYQKNLGVNGSMSSSILVDGRLWGLVIGHHTRPHYVAPETRAAVTALSDGLGLRIGKLELLARWRQQEAHVAVETGLLGGWPPPISWRRPFWADDRPSPTSFDAGGAALVEGDAAVLLGRTPPESAVLAVADWLRASAPEGAYATDQLAQAYPPGAAHAAVAAGLLAAFTGPERRRALLWFKPEEVSSVAWGGDPRKAVEATATAVLPRRSFERWVEERRGVSTPWPSWQVAAAGRIAAAVEASRCARTAASRCWARSRRSSWPCSTRRSGCSPTRTC